MLGPRIILLALCCFLAGCTAPGEAADNEFYCTPIAVWDGDGPIWCDEGPKIRLAGIAARELDNTCSAGHPCPGSSGLEARDALVHLLGGSIGTRPRGHIRVAYPTIQCVARGTSYERVVASCILEDGRDLGDALLDTGTVLPW